MIEVISQPPLTRLNCLDCLAVEDYRSLLQLTLEWNHSACRNLLLDWTKLKTLESTALRGLSQLGATVLTGGGRIAIAGCPSELRKLLRDAYWEDCFEWYDQVDAALVKLR